MKKQTNYNKVILAGASAEYDIRLDVDVEDDGQTKALIWAEGSACLFPTLNSPQRLLDLATNLLNMANEIMEDQND